MSSGQVCRPQQTLCRILTPPCNPCTGGTIWVRSTNRTLNPGTYTNLSIQANGNVTFNAGTYIFTAHGLSCCMVIATIRGNWRDVLLHRQCHLNCNGNTDVQLTAPTSGTYAGILMYQNPADTEGPQIGGNNTSFFKGVLYFPKSEVTFYGNGTGYAVGIVVADAFASKW